MFFGPGKRKGYSSFKVVDRSTKSQKAIVKLPSTLPQEEEELRAQDVHEDDISAEFEEDEVPDAASTAYQLRKERLHRNWETIRTKLIKSSLQMEGFAPQECVENDCSKTVESRCRDCSFTAYYCLDCCNRLHQTKHHFHQPEIKKDGVWKLHNVPNRILFNSNHSCSCMYTREITVIDEKGGQHVVKIVCCTCYSVSESFLWQGLWPATPVEPTLAFTTALMEFAMALMMECQVSIFDIVKALNFSANPLIKKRKIYVQFLDSFEEFRYHVKALQFFTEDEVCALKAPVCPACPKKQKLGDILEAVVLACPQFHVYGHGAKCQLLYSPRRLEGWGMVDGEVLERLWSYLSLFRKMTKEMSASHREDIISDALFYLGEKQRSKIVLLMVKQRSRLTELKHSAELEIEDIKKKSPVPIKDEMIQEWKRDEAAILNKSKPDDVDLGPHGWVIHYFTLLQKYYLSRDQLASGSKVVQSLHLIELMNSLDERLLKVEKEYKIQSRWSPTDPQYRSSLVTCEAVRAKQTLDLILVSGRRRWFLLSLKKKYTDGQAQAKRLSKSITKESSNLRKQLKLFNSCVEILRQHDYSSFSPLTWEDVSDVNSAIYTINIPNEDNVPVCIKRSAVDAQNLIARCSEEMKYLDTEMSNTIAAYFRQCLELERCLSSLASRQEFEVSTMLQGLYSINRKQLYNERVRLFAASNLFKKFITSSSEVTDYMCGHTQEVNVLDFCITGEEVESDEDDDIESDNED